MAASHSDSYLLSGDVGHQHRVQAGLVTACINISNEGYATLGPLLHRQRALFAANILSTPATLASAVAQFSVSVATDASCLADATVGGTVVLTTGNAAAQAALVTDAHIDAAIASQFNSFITGAS